MHLILEGGGEEGWITRTHLPDSPEYKHSFSLWPFPLSLSVQLYIYEPIRRMVKLHTRLWNFQREIFSTFFLGRLSKIWLIEEQLDDKLRKLIQDGETYDNVSYYVSVYFKPIVYLGYKTAIDRRFFPPTCWSQSEVLTKLLTIGIFFAWYFHIFLFRLRKRWYNNILVTTCVDT